MKVIYNVRKKDFDDTLFIITADTEFEQTFLEDAKRKAYRGQREYINLSASFSRDAEGKAIIRINKGRV